MNYDERKALEAAVRRHIPSFDSYGKIPYGAYMESMQDICWEMLEWERARQKEERKKKLDEATDLLEIYL